MIKKNVNRLTLRVLSLLFISFSLLTSCEKDDTPSTPPENQQTVNNNGNNNQNNNSNSVLCDGNGSNSYFPLKVGNKWAWKAAMGNYRLKAEVIEKKQINGNEYFKLDFKEFAGSMAFGGFTRYLREVNGSIYYAIESTDNNTGNNVWTDYLWIPATPQLNQNWEVLGLFNSTVATYRDHITSINITQTSSGCTYTGGVKVQTKKTDTNTGAVTSLSYEIFKKGLGIINYNGKFLYEVTLN